MIGGLTREDIETWLDWILSLFFEEPLRILGNIGKAVQRRNKEKGSLDSRVGIPNSCPRLGRIFDLRIHRRPLLLYISLPHSQSWLSISTMAQRRYCPVIPVRVTWSVTGRSFKWGALHELPLCVINYTESISFVNSGFYLIWGNRLCSINSFSRWTFRCYCNSCHWLSISLLDIKR